MLTRRAEAIGIAVVILVLAMSGWMIYRAGETKGAISQHLVDNAKAIKAADQLTALHAKQEAILKLAADSATAQAKRSAEQLRIARAKVIVVGDTVKADGAIVNLPSVASLIRTCDTHSADDTDAIAKLQADLAGEETRIEDLTRDIALRDDRIKTLNLEKNPRFGFFSGVVAGVAGVLAVLAAVHR